MRGRIEIALVVLLCAVLAAGPSAPAEVGVAMLGATLAGATAIRLETTAATLAETTPVLRVARLLHDVAIALSLLSLLFVLRPF